MKGICEVCHEEREVEKIEGHLVCADCVDDFIWCDYCHAFLGINYDDLMQGNFGRLSVPELSLPDMMMNLIFCNIEHLEAYLRIYKEQNHMCSC